VRITEKKNIKREKRRQGDRTDCPRRHWEPIDRIDAADPAGREGPYSLWGQIIDTGGKESGRAYKVGIVTKAHRKALQRRRLIGFTVSDRDDETNGTVERIGLQEFTP